MPQHQQSSLPYAHLSRGAKIIIILKIYPTRIEFLEFLQIPEESKAALKLGTHQGHGPTVAYFRGLGIPVPNRQLFQQCRRSPLTYEYGKYAQPRNSGALIDSGVQFYVITQDWQEQVQIRDEKELDMLTHEAKIDIQTYSILYYI